VVWLEGMVRPLSEEVSTMFRNILNLLCPGRNRADSARSCSSAPPRLEELEARLTPMQIPTITTASVLVVPNLSSMTVSEVVTATVANTPTGSEAGYPLGTILTVPLPPGTPNPGGSVNIGLNNQQQNVQLDGNGQARAIFTLPLFVLLTGQQLSVQYSGADIGTLENIYRYGVSYFNSPLYLNFDNLLSPASVTFVPFSPDQEINNARNPVPLYYSVNGETDNFGALSFQYADPGVITGIQVFGLQLPPSFAAAVGAYGPEF
jgi:hypothetical protein